MAAPRDKVKVILGTLEDGADSCIDGSPEQVGKVYDLIVSKGGTVCGFLLSMELHQSGKKHYHFLVVYKNPVQSSMVYRLRTVFDVWLGTCKTNRIEYPKYTDRTTGQQKISAKWHYWCSYMCKEYKSGSVLRQEGIFTEDVWKPFADLYIPNDGVRRASIAALIKQTESNMRANAARGLSITGGGGDRDHLVQLQITRCERDSTELKERDRVNNGIKVLKTILERENWRVEKKNRMIIDMSTIEPVKSDELMLKVGEEILVQGGQDVLFQKSNVEKFLLEIISDRTKLELPTCELQFGWVELGDCKYNFISGIPYALGDPNVVDILCIRKYKKTLASALKPPVNWLEHLKHLVTDREVLVMMLDAYRKMFLKRTAKHKFVSLYGAGNTGKDTAHAPFLSIFKTQSLTINAMNRFSFRPGFHIHHWKDVKLTEQVKDAETNSQLKAFREGKPVTVNVKHKTSEVCEPVHIVHSSQDDFDDVEGSDDMDIQAYVTRAVMCFVGPNKRILSRKAVNIEDIIEAEAPNVMIYLTCKQSQLTNEELCLSIGVSPHANEDSELMTEDLEEDDRRFSLEEILGIPTDESSVRKIRQAIGVKLNDDGMVGGLLDSACSVPLVTDPTQMLPQTAAAVPVVTEPTQPKPIEKFLRTNYGDIL